MADCGQVDVMGDECGHRIDRRDGPMAVFGCGHQTQVPRRHRQFVGARDRAEHGHTRVLAGLSQDRLVARGAHPIEDDPRHADGAVERREPVQQCGDAVALAAGVDDQDDGRSEQSRDVRRRAAGGTAGVHVDAAVEESHHTLHHRDVGAFAAVPVERADQVVADQDGIEVAPG
jgi:hypothetical protein